MAYNSVSTAIPYQVERLNIGNAMNLGSGVFTAPTNGRYFFSFVARSNVAVTYIQLCLNGDKFAESYTPLTNYNLPISATLNLKTGDRVDAAICSPAQSLMTVIISPTLQDFCSKKT